MLSTNQSSVFSNLQCHLADSIFNFDFDFLEVDRYQWKEQAEPVILEWTCQKMLSVN